MNRVLLLLGHPGNRRLLGDWLGRHYDVVSAGLDGEFDAPFDLAYAIRVGALDGRHPEAGKRALLQIAVVLTPQGRLFIDGGTPLQEVDLPQRPMQTPVVK